MNVQKSIYFLVFDRSSLSISKVGSVEEVNEEDKQSDVDDEGGIQEGVRGVTAMTCRL